MQDLEAWKLAEELSVYQIALLMTGFNPSDFNDNYFAWPKKTMERTRPYVGVIKNKAGRMRPD